MQQKYSAVHVANFFIQKAIDDNIVDMTPLKIQKLVYIATGWTLSLINTDILGGEEIEAWQHGPVIPSLYHSLKRYKNSHVADLIEENYDAIFGLGE